MALLREQSPIGESDPGLESIVSTAGLPPTPAEKRFAQQRTEDQGGAYHGTFSRTGDALTETNRARIIPLHPGPYDIPCKLSEVESGIHRTLVSSLIQSNNAGLRSNLTYLEEAYYFVPVHLALQLQQSGHYAQALDWFRTVYDYSMPRFPEDQRKIYHGLRLEESSSWDHQRATDWLLDPLNPHAIASTRRNTYSRFTLLSVARCLLDFADAEFTRDTAESVPRARTLYLTALDLLDQPELTQRLGLCEDLIGTLNIQVDDPYVLTAWAEIKKVLAEVDVYSSLVTIVDKVKSELADSDDWN